MTSPAPMARFHPITQNWFHGAFDQPTTAQLKAWPAIGRGESITLLAPTGSGKTLAAFLSALDALIFSSLPLKNRSKSSTFLR